MRITKVLLLISCLCLNSIPSLAWAQNVDDCKFPRNENANVSLGFPMRSERLAGMKNPKILVLPYRLQGEAEISLSQKVFREVSQDIAKLSKDLSVPEFIYSQTVEIPFSSTDLEELKKTSNQSWLKDFQKSTWGFAEKVINFADKSVNFNGIDAVVLYGKSPNPTVEFAEAMMFTSDSSFKQNPMKSESSKWFDPIKTNEGLIANAVLLHNREGRNLFTHEIMHLYGLVDLYGGQSGPGYLSLMDSQSINLLTYEKWILGWHKQENVQCLATLDSTITSRFTFEFSLDNQLMLVKTKSGVKYVIETMQHQDSTTLVFFKLEIEKYPPITIYNDPKLRGFVGVPIDSPYKIGTQLISPDFTLLISDLDASKITIDLIGNSKTTSPEFNELVILANSTKEKRVSELAAREKLEAESRLAAAARAEQEKQERAAAEIKAKLEAEAKAAVLTKTTIICVKGKLTKKVTAVKPKCPSGYKVKK